MDEDRHRYIRSALFVDFDNIFIGLKNQNQAAAIAFGTEPLRWLSWLSKSLPSPYMPNGTKRSILMRVCYLNPKVMSRYRPFFVNSGFRVVDCPALTKASKNAADIQMALEAVEALDHPTRFDEFIMFAVDADYTPVNYRLRAHDRHIVMLKAGPASQAIQASCDHMIPLTQFMAEALGVNSSSSAPNAAPADQENRSLAKQLQARVIELVTESARPIPLTELGKTLRNQHGPAIENTKWFGHKTLTRFIKSFTGDRLKIAREGAEYYTVYDPSRHSIQEYEGQPTSIKVPSEATQKVMDEVTRLTTIPRLPPDDYAVLFSELANELSSNQGHREQEVIGSAVKRRCQLRGHNISKKDILYVVQAMDDRGHLQNSNTSQSADDFAQSFAHEMLQICQNTGMEFTDSDRDAFFHWFCSKEGCHLEGDDSPPGEVA